MNHSPSLPLDVLISILDAVAQDADSNTATLVLRNCALTCQSLLPFCRKHLFRTFDTRKQTWMTTHDVILLRFYNLLSANPHLVPYVRTFHISDVGHRFLLCGHLMLPPLLRLLTLLETFGLTMATNLLWATLPEPFRTSVEELLSRPRVSSLYLSGIEDLPIALLRRCYHLKSLYIHVDNTIPDSDSDSEDSEDGYDINHVDLDSLLSGLSTRPKPMHSESSFPVVLEELSLANSDVVLRAILVESIFDFSHLQKLAMDVSRTNLNAVWTVIHPARASLSELSFRQSYIRGWTLDAFSFDTSSFPNTTAHRAHPLPKHISLSPLTRLHHLSFSIIIQDHMCPPHPRLFSSWCSLLRTAPPTILTLHIKLDFFFLAPQRLLDWFIPKRTTKSSSSLLTSSTPLSELDEILATPALFPRLEHVTVEIQLPDDEDVDSTEDEWDSDDDDDEEEEEEAGAAGRRNNYQRMDRYPVTFGEVKVAVNRMMRLTRRRLRASKNSFHVGVGFGQGLGGVDESYAWLLR